jgi:hypothetical protein
MQFRTIIPIEKSKKPIDYDSNILLLGSCFAENIGEKFDYFKFNNRVNPFGILFNPVSLEKVIERIVEKKYYTESDIFFHNDLWHCFEVHSELSNPDKALFLENLNRIIDQLHVEIETITHCQITYGTAWVYASKESGQIVANCHKVPQKQFDKKLLSAAAIEQSVNNTINLLRKVNPECHFIFTISPVRHIKDGFIENQQSKSHMISALHKAIINYGDYFPSYEIMMDELRDYRFYEEDMLHPNQVAIDYIWKRFLENYLSPDCGPVMEEVNSIQKSLAHKPFNPNTESHQKFLKALKLKIAKLQQSFPQIKF